MAALSRFKQTANGRSLCNAVAVERPSHGDILGEQLTVLQDAWLSWLRGRHPSLANAHPDLIQQTTADLWQWVANQSDRPDLDAIRKIGFRVLQRRVADAFRAPERRWSAFIEALDPENPRHADTDAQPPDALAFVQLLKAVSAVVSGLSAEERKLLFNEVPAAGAQRRKPLTTAQRKRISRLRQKMRLLLHERHGIILDNQR